MCIFVDLVNTYPYFQTVNDASGGRSFNALQKYTSTVCQLAYAHNPDSLD